MDIEGNWFLFWFYISIVGIGVDCLGERTEVTSVVETRVPRFTTLTHVLLTQFTACHTAAVYKLSLQLHSYNSVG